MIFESTPKTRFVMKMSEKFKIEEEGKIFRRRSRSYVEERFYLMTKILDFAAICNRKGVFGVDSSFKITYDNNSKNPIRT